MKKLLAAMVAVTMLWQAISVSAAEHFILSYNITEKAIKIVGTIGKEAGIGVTVNIAEYTEEEPIFSPSQLPLISYLYQTEENGAVDFSVPISNQIGSGKYRVILYGDGYKESDSIILVNYNDEETIEVLSLLNRCAQAVEMEKIIREKGDKIGIDIVLVGDFIQSACQYVLHWKTNDFTVECFSDLFWRGTAAGMISNGNVDEAMRRYSDKFGISYSDYRNMNEEYRSVLNSYLEKADYFSAETEQIYQEASLLTDLQQSASWSDLKEILCSNYELIGFQPEKEENYEKITDTSKYLVFLRMYENKAALNQISDIRKEFLKLAQEVYEDTQSNDPIKNSPGTGSGGGSRGGGAITHKDQVLQPVHTEDANVEFYDIEGHFSKEAVMKLKENGFISGYEDGSFKPEYTITRAEFSKMMVDIFDIPQNADAAPISFRDVNGSAWYAQYVNILASNEIIMGFDGEFMPEVSISREDAAVMIHRALSFKGINIAGEYQFEDSDDISNYAKNAVEALAYESILIGDNGFFHPKDLIKRGEAAVMFSRIMDTY